MSPVFKKSTPNSCLAIMYFVEQANHLRKRLETPSISYSYNYVETNLGRMIVLRSVFSAIPMKLVLLLLVHWGPSQSVLLFSIVILEHIDFLLSEAHHKRYCRHCDALPRIHSWQFLTLDFRSAVRESWIVFQTDWEARDELQNSL